MSRFNMTTYLAKLANAVALVASVSQRISPCLASVKGGGRLYLPVKKLLTQPANSRMLYANHPIHPNHQHPIHPIHQHPIHPIHLIPTP